MRLLRVELKQSVCRWLLLPATCFALSGPVFAQEVAPAQSTEIIENVTPDLTQEEAELPSSTLPSGRDSSPVSPILTVDQDALFVNSAWGARVQSEIDAAGREIAAENEQLMEQLSSEEADLTEKRKRLPASEFRELAEAFDQRATEIRRERAQLVQDLSASAEEEREAFYRAALPIMGEVLAERGAQALLDRRTVFLSIETIDVTDELITRLDEALGDGSGAR